MDYDELLLKLQRFAGDGDESGESYPETLPGEPGYAGGDGGSGDGDQVQADQSTFENTQERINDAQNGINEDAEKLYTITSGMDDGTMNEDDRA